MYTNTGERLYMLDLYPLVAGSRIYCHGRRLSETIWRLVPLPVEEPWQKESHKAKHIAPCLVPVLPWLSRA